MDGVLPILLAGPHIQIADPIPRVRVGVTNIRRKFVFPLVPSCPPACILPVENIGEPHVLCGYFTGNPSPPSDAFPGIPNGDTGQTDGIARLHHSGIYPHAPIVIGIVTQVRAENIGIEVGDHSGDAHPAVPGSVLPRMDIGLPGAIGAQLSGKFIHPPQPNPQASPSIRFCVALTIPSADELSNPILI